TTHRKGRNTTEHIEPEYLRMSKGTQATMMLALSDGMPHPSQVVVRGRGDGRLRVVWEPVEGATGYLVAFRRPGETTFENQINSSAGSTWWDCTCFADFSGIAVGAMNENGIIGPLSPEVRPPQQGG